MKILCRFCECPVAEGGLLLSEVDRDALSSWWSKCLHTELDAETLVDAWGCRMCVSDARFWHENCDGKLAADLVWWPSLSDEHFYDFYKDHELKTSSVNLKKLGESDFEDLEVKVEKICCDLCEEKFFIPANLDLHVKRKHQCATENSENQPQTCLFCGKLFKNKNTYRQHLKVVHKDEAIRCKYRQCLAVFKTENCLKEHYIKEHCFIKGQTNRQNALENQPIKCLFCSKLFKSKAIYSKHLKLLHKEKVFRCKYATCFTVFKTEKSLEEHLIEKHFSKKRKHSVECKVCKIWISSKNKLNKHVAQKHSLKVKTIKCEFCPASFDSKLNLRNHTKENHKEAIECRLQPCNLYFKSIVEMENHFKNAHQINCKFCQSSFSSNQRYLIHLKTLHLEKKCKFSKCALYPDSKEELENHLKEKHCPKFKNNLECVYCGKHYESRANMLNHIRQFHSKIAIRCEKRKCALFFKCQDDLEKHKKEVHTKVERHKKTVECLYCQKVIWDKLTYAGHIKSQHSKEAIRCKYPQCFTFFKSEEDRKNHLEEKHPEKYCCALCDYKTSKRYSISNHFERLHFPKDKKCPHCPKVFGSRIDLREHINYNHKPHEKCPHCKKVGTNLNRHVVTTNCPACFRPFLCKKLYSDHKLKCKKVHECRRCAKTFKLKMHLKQHIYQRHKSGQK